MKDIRQKRQKIGRVLFVFEIRNAELQTFSSELDILLDKFIEKTNLLTDQESDA